MWKTMTLDQSMASSLANARKKESCELPVAMMMVAEPVAWAIPLSAIGDAAMALVAYLVHRKAQTAG
jgi:hypothetical protein